MASLFTSIHAPKHPPLFIQFATSDDDLKRRLSESDWLQGRDFTLPKWLNSVEEPLIGDPSLISYTQIEALQQGSIPADVHERRYIRNQAAIKQITSEIARKAASLQVSKAQTKAATELISPNSPPDTHSCGDMAGSGLQTNQNQPATTTPGKARDPRLSNGDHAEQSNGQAVIIKPESDEEQAERLRMTVLAPFFDRIKKDGDEIVRLRAEKASLTAEVEKHRTQLIKHTDDTADDDTPFDSPSQRRSLKRKASLTSPMRLGDAVNSNNEHTKEGHLAHLANKICKDLGEPVPNEKIHFCGLAPLKLLDERPDEVLALAHEKLHTWRYQHVPMCWRRLWEDASLSKAAQLLRQRAGVLDRPSKRRRIDDTATDQSAEQRDWLTEVVRILDRGITLSGSPGRSATFEAVFQQLENHLEDQEKADVPNRFDIVRPGPLETEHPITRINTPMTFTAFQTHLDKFTTPLIIPGVLSEWPAAQKWHNPSYFLSMTLGGRRLIPVEIGKSYTDEDWSQSAMTFANFLQNHLLPKDPQDVGYLAQHDLFAQIPALRADITIPDYCYTTPPNIPTDDPASQTPGLHTSPQLAEPLLNAWLGPKGTKTPLHTDPYHNILCQVVGNKYIRLYPPTETPRLYPHGTDAKGIDMANTSQVDVAHARSRSLGGSTDLDARREMLRRFPLFSEAAFVEAVLAPGECLFVPLGWWHYVEALTTSFSVSFWWN